MTFDAAVVGAGVIGLAHAWHLARRGLEVVVLERSPRAQGASVRNFGMLWPIGQPAGERRATALRSRALWGELLAEAGIWHETRGSLHLAHADDEAAVLREFAAQADDLALQWWEPSAVRDAAPGVRAEGLRGALYSPTEACVDPRDAIARLPEHLARRYGVTFRFGCPVTRATLPEIATGAGPIRARRLFVCTGHDTRTLFPDAYDGAGLTPCKLQMMRTGPQPRNWRLGPMLAAGLTLGHYEGFRACPSLPGLLRRFAAEFPEHGRWGIHVLVSQTEGGALTLGDSHEYGDAVTPFDRPEIDELILGYLGRFFAAPSMDVVERWHGIYLKNPSGPWFVAQPAEGVTVVTGLGGAGMTLSMGLAERVVEEAIG